MADTEEGCIVQESLCRFIFDSQDINQLGRVKDGAFLPSFGADRRLETSVCRTHELDDDTTWQIGRETRPDRHLKGRADFTTEIVSGQNLRTEPDTVGTFAQHAVVLGWPETKLEQKILAREIAKASQGLIVPKPPVST